MDFPGKVLFSYCSHVKEGVLGDIRNKTRKMEEEQRRKDANDREETGWTVFYFNFDPKLTRRNMTVGEAIRHLLRITSTRLAWWRCPVRGLSIQYRRLPQTTYKWDSGETYRALVFSKNEDEVAAKRELVTEMLLTGIDLYRALPNKVFDMEVATLCWLLNAPPSVPAEDWLGVKNRLQKQSVPALEAHEATLRKHLLGQVITTAEDLQKLTVTSRLKSLNDRR
jgi:hypothetical protein